MMKRQLNISELKFFAQNSDTVFVQDNLAIIRDIAKIKEQMVANSLGDLLYVPMGRIVLVNEGWAQLRVNMQPCRAEQGCALVIPENFFMEVSEVSADYDAQIVAFGDVPIPFRQWALIPLERDDFVRILQYINLLWQVAHIQPFPQTVAVHIVNALMEDLHLQDSKIKNQHSQDAAPTAAEQLMRRFFDLLSGSDGTAHSVSYFADRLCVTPNHLSAVVKQQSGQTVMQLLNAHTVLHAKVLLRYSDLPVGEIADRLGFENPPAFNRFFKRETGVTPGSLRKGSQQA